jgi:hypothetical protein
MRRRADECAYTCACGCAARRGFESARARVSVGSPAGQLWQRAQRCQARGKPRASYGEMAPGEPGDHERRRLWHAREACAPERPSRARVPVRGGVRWRHGGATRNGKEGIERKKIERGCTRGMTVAAPARKRPSLARRPASHSASATVRRRSR